MRWAILQLSICILFAAAATVHIQARRHCMPWQAYIWLTWREFLDRAKDGR